MEPTVKDENFAHPQGRQKLNELQEKFLIKVLDTWPKKVGDFFEYLDLLNRENSVDGKRQQLVIFSQMLKKTIRKKKQNFFRDCFPTFVKWSSTSTALARLKSSLYRVAVETENTEALSILSKHNFLPRDQEFIAQVICGDQALFRDLEQPQVDGETSHGANEWTEKKCGRAVGISYRLRHRLVNINFLNKLLTFPSLKKSFDFASIVKRGAWSMADKFIEESKFFMERGDPVDKLGQVFIDSATYHRLLWPTSHIDNLLFLVRHGGTKIDRVCSDFDNFFRLVVRQVGFETGRQELLIAVRQHLDGLINFLSAPDILPVTNLVHVVLLYL